MAQTLGQLDDAHSRKVGGRVGRQGARGGLGLKQGGDEFGLGVRLACCLRGEFLFHFGLRGIDLE
ncbi:MAG: hypothetical protein B7Z20_12915, partial [Sphingobium sp. 32-64-5]